VRAKETLVNRFRIARGAFNGVICNELDALRLETTTSRGFFAAARVMDSRFLLLFSLPLPREAIAENSQAESGKKTIVDTS